MSLKYIVLSVPGFRPLPFSAGSDDYGCRAPVSPLTREPQVITASHWSITHNTRLSLVSAPQLMVGPAVAEVSARGCCNGQVRKREHPDWQETILRRNPRIDAEGIEEKVAKCTLLCGQQRQHGHCGRKEDDTMCNGRRSIPDLWVCASWALCTYQTWFLAAPSACWVCWKNFFVVLNFLW